MKILAVTPLASWGSVLEEAKKGKQYNKPVQRLKSKIKQPKTTSGPVKSFT